MQRAPRLSLSRTLVYAMASAGINLVSMTTSTRLLYFCAPPAGRGRARLSYWKSVPGLGVFQGYRLGDTPGQTRSRLSLPEA